MTPSHPTTGNGGFDGLRILGFCDHFTESSSGGAEKVTAEVYARLRDQGAEITVVTAVPGRRAEKTSVQGTPTRVVPALDLAKVLNAQVTLAPHLIAAANRLIEEVRPQVLHAAGIHFPASITAALLARRRQLPLVVTGHLASGSELAAPMRAMTTAYEQTVGRFILRSSSRVIAVSQAAADHLRSLGAPAEKTTVINNGVDHARFLPGSRDPGRPRVVFIGRLIRNKGPAETLSAFAALHRPDTELTFVGDGPLRSRLEEITARLDLTRVVRFTGHLDEVASVLASADVFIRPSRTEGQSLAILEAMAAGVAVLVSDIPPNRELVSDGWSGLLAPVGDTRRLTEQLRRLLGDGRLRDRLAAEGRRRAQQHSWDECARRTGLVLAQAAGGLKGTGCPYA